MKRGFYTIMSAQFFSSLADNALFVGAVQLLRTSGAPEWQQAALVPMFALFYVILAPFVGAFADSMPKGRVMLFSNFIKIFGCLMMLFGTHPLMSYAIVGLGAAAYSPAKYGILTELLPASQLVKANGWIEGLTIAGPEIRQQRGEPFGQWAHFHARVGDVGVEPGGQQVNKNQDTDGGLGCGIDAGVDEGEVE